VFIAENPKFEDKQAREEALEEAVRYVAKDIAPVANKPI